MTRFSLLDLLEGFHLSHIVGFLHDEGILHQLDTPLHPREIAGGGRELEREAP